jgi:phosphoribosylformylglycinamidine synthase I
MNHEKPRVLVMTGFGLNCERETGHALRLAGADVDLMHLNDLIERPQCLADYGLLAFIGGFSFGDHIAAGRALAIRMKYRLVEPLAGFVREGGLVIGICNGFQVLVKLGLLPGFEPFHQDIGQQVTLTHNESGVFRNAWVRLRVNPDSPCVFTQGLNELELPIRHGEGRFIPKDASVLERLRQNGQVVFRYTDGAGESTQEFPANPNGSVDAIAGICDPSGRVFGTMPHPEAAVFPLHHPDAPACRVLRKPEPVASGLKIFRNAVEYLQSHMPV